MHKMGVEQTCQEFSYVHRLCQMWFFNSIKAQEKKK